MEITIGAAVLTPDVGQGTVIRIETLRHEGVWAWVETALGTRVYRPRSLKPQEGKE